MDWRPIASARYDRDLELAVIDGGGTHALLFPCRRSLAGWTDAATKKPVVLHPTDWREWQSVH
jgi:hypothetical protein